MISIETVPDGWAPVSFSSGVLPENIRKFIYRGEEIAMWRTSEGRIGAIVDRCPHRAAALSLGTLKEDRLVCPYHGWEFEFNGKCARRPRVGWKDDYGPSAKTFACLENSGLIWLGSDEGSLRGMNRLISETAKITYTFSDRIDLHWYYVVENLMDVTHFPFVHLSSFSSMSFGDDGIKPKYVEKAFGFECFYTVPLSPQGLFKELVGDTSSCTVKASFLAPYTQLFEVRYDNGTFYGNVQAVCPLSDQSSAMFMVGFSESPFDANFAKTMENADISIWNEDKRIIESVRLPFPGIAKLPTEHLDAETGDLNRIYINRALKRWYDARKGFSEKTTEHMIA